MNTEANPSNTDQNIISPYYEDYKQTQAEIFAKECKRVRNSILTIAGLLFASELLGLAMANLVSSQNILYSLLFPAIFIGLAFLAIRQPMLSVILAALVFVGIIILSIVAYGGLGAISGILVKAIIIYLLLAGFQSATTAEKAKKELQR